MSECLRSKIRSGMKTRIIFHLTIPFFDFSVIRLTALFFTPFNPFAILFVHKWNSTKKNHLKVTCHPPSVSPARQQHSLTASTHLSYHSWGGTISWHLVNIPGELEVYFKLDTWELPVFYGDVNFRRKDQKVKPEGSLMAEQAFSAMGWQSVLMQVSIVHSWRITI